MISELLAILIKLVELLWPFHIVEKWERGLYLICGKPWRIVQPGLKVGVPWFMRVVAVSIAEAIVGTGRQDITLLDGSTLSFAATATVKVIDVEKAVMEVDNYQQTAQELLSSVLADRLAGYDAERLKPAGRGRLQTDLVRWINDDAERYGLEYGKVRFTSFVLNAKTHRLLIDQNALAQW